MQFLSYDMHSPMLSIKRMWYVYQTKRSDHASSSRLQEVKNNGKTKRLSAQGVAVVI